VFTILLSAVSMSRVTPSSTILDVCRMYVYVCMYVCVYICMYVGVYVFFLHVPLLAVTLHVFFHI
jgi:hypothetical protein